MKKGVLVSSIVMLMVLLCSQIALAAKVEGNPFEGLELCIAYDFDFWPEDDDTIGTKHDKNIFFTEANQAGISMRFTATKEGAFKDSGKKEGLAFKFESIWETGLDRNYVAFTLSQRHDYNLYAFDEFPDAKYFTLYIDTTNYNRNFSFYPIIYEQDYDEADKEAGISCLAIKEGTTFYLKDLDGVITSAKAGNNYITLPRNFVGRIYLPLEDYVPIWGTSDVNGKFDGIKVLTYKFSFVDIGTKGEYVIFDEFGFLL